MSKTVLVARIARLIIIAGAVASVACADRMTSPAPATARAKASRDVIQGDTMTCFSGYVILNGWYHCT